MSRTGEDPGPGLLGADPDCGDWEAQLAELVEGTLLPEQEAALRRHSAQCAHCGTLLEEAAQGREWVRVLHAEPPQVPSELLDRILARTSQAGPPPLEIDGLLDSEAEAGTRVVPMGLPGAVVVPQAAVFALRSQRQARVVMTAAMAVFSLALTVSLTLSMTRERLGGLHPSNLVVAATRQFFDTKKQMVIFYDNLLLVREVEAAVQTMRRSANEGGGGDSHPRESGPSAWRRPAFVPAPKVMAGCVPATDGRGLSAENKDNDSSADPGGAMSTSSSRERTSS